MNILKKTTCILFLIPSLASFAQKKDVKNLEQRLVVLNYPDSTVKCEIMITPKEIETSDDLEYFWYYTDELKSNVGGYSGFLLHGKYNVFDLEKNLIEEGYFKNGLRQGIWKRWDRNGNLIYHTEWDEGKQDGICIVYNKKGEKIRYEEYKKGLKNGKEIIYKDGEEKTTRFKNGEIVERNLFKKSTDKKERKLFNRKNKEKEIESDSTMVETENN